MAEQAVDAGFITRYGRLKTALTGVELNGRDELVLQRLARASAGSVASFDDGDLHHLAELIERARYAGPGRDGLEASRLAAVPPLPVVPGGDYEPKHKGEIR